MVARHIETLLDTQKSRPSNDEPWLVELLGRISNLFCGEDAEAQLRSTPDTVLTSLHRGSPSFDRERPS
jgi:hypothetical protein